MSKPQEALPLELFFKVIDENRNGIVITDARQRDNPIVFANRAFEELTGYHRDEILGKNCRFLQGADRDQVDRPELRNAVQEGRDFRGVLRNYRKNGELFYNELSITPVYDSHGKLEYFIGIQKNVTERIILENNLRDARDSERAASRRMTKVLALVSHDAKNLLTAIRFYAAGVKPQTEPIENMLLCVEKLQNLFKEILDKSRLGSGNLVVSSREIDFEAFLETIRKLVLPLAHPKNVQLYFHVAQDLPKIQTDPVYFQQVLLNLLSNAIKYNRQDGSVELHIALSDDGQWLICQVRDTGKGIPADQHEQIFKEYYRIESKSLIDEESIEGSGLGLAYTRSLIDLLGGSIAVESKEGVGSVFTVRLPSGLQTTSARVDALQRSEITV